MTECIDPSKNVEHILRRGGSPNRDVHHEIIVNPLYDLSPTTRFADRASDYAAFRPSYPKEAIAAALAGFASVEGLVAADIGAGTGICSRLFADRGIRVLAVEPNAAMRESAEAHPLVTFIDGTGEATGLGTASVDLVVCAQAFHWLRPQEALREFDRIVKPRGRIVFLVNERDQANPVMCAYNAAIRKASDRELSEGMRGSIDHALRAAGDHALRAAGDQALRAAGDQAVPGAGVALAPASFPSAQVLSREGLVGRARSASYVPKEGPRYEQLLRDLEALWTEHHDDLGRVTLGYRTYVWVL